MSCSVPLGAAALGKSAAALSLEDFPPLSTSKGKVVSTKTFRDALAQPQPPKPSPAPFLHLSEGCLNVLDNVHQDDIHGLLRLPDQTFISGSKDGCIKKWNFRGEHVKDVFLAEGIDYHRWVTALGIFSDRQWMSGTRDGRVALWDVSGSYIRSLGLSPFTGHGKSQTSKSRNLDRVLCLVKSNSARDNPIFFTGWPTQFTVHNLATNERLNYSITHRNDWVYCIHPLAEKSILVVTGSKLEVWEAVSPILTRWKAETTLIKEAPRTEGSWQQRPFISSVTSLDSHPSYFGLSLFNGGDPEKASVQVYDIEARRTIMQGFGHEGRAWKIESLAPRCFASCGDEGTIKIWDICQAQPVVTLRDNLRQRARVSTVLKLDDNTLVSGSCPDDIRATREKARLCFRDWRKMHGVTS